MKIHLGAELIRADILRSQAAIEKEEKKTGKKSKKIKRKKIMKAILHQKGNKVEYTDIVVDDLPARFRYEERKHPRKQ
jgi:hypothetical protein